MLSTPFFNKELPVRFWTESVIKRYLHDPLVLLSTTMYYILQSNAAAYKAKQENYLLYRSSTAMYVCAASVV